MTINTFGSDFNTVLFVYTDFQNGFGNFTLVANNDQFDGDQSQVTFPVNAGQCFEVRVSGFANDQGNVSLQGFASPPANDNFDDAIFLKLPFDFTATNVDATVQPGEPFTQSVGATVWWEFQAQSNGMVTVTMDGLSGFSVIPNLTAWTDIELGLENLAFLGANFGFDHVTFQVNAGQFYAIRVGGFSDEMGQFDLSGTLSPSVLLGDVNMDGVVNLLDVAPFVDRITSGVFQAEADINGDGAVNLLDIAPFIEILTGP